MNHNLKTYVSNIKDEIKGTEEMIEKLPLKVQKEYHTGRKHGYLDALEELEPVVEELQQLDIQQWCFDRGYGKLYVEVLEHFRAKILGVMRNASEGENQQ